MQPKMTPQECGRLGGIAKRDKFKRYEEKDVKIESRKFEGRYIRKVRTRNNSPNRRKKNIEFEISIDVEIAKKVGLANHTIVSVALAKTAEYRIEDIKDIESMELEHVIRECHLYSSGTLYLQLSKQLSDKMGLCKGDKLLVLLDKAAEEEMTEYKEVAIARTSLACRTDTQTAKR